MFLKYFNKHDKLQAMSSSSIPIGLFSSITQLTSKALRIYDEKEILTANRDPYTGYRYYSVDQIGDGIKIKMLVTMGFSLNEIKETLDMAYEGENEKISIMFKKRLNEIQIEINRLQTIENIIKAHDPLELLEMRCTQPTKKIIPKMRVISKKGQGQYGQVIGQLIGELIEVVSKSQANISGPIMFISHDKEYRDYDANIEVAIPITGRISIPDKIEIKYIEESLVVSMVFTGPYSEVGMAHGKMHKYILEHNLEISENVREVYLNSPQDVDEDQLMTELQYPIRRMANV